jgi:hypothetical protein
LEITQIKTSGEDSMADKKKEYKKPEIKEQENLEKITKSSVSNT